MFNVDLSWRNHSLLFVLASSLVIGCASGSVAGTGSSEPDRGTAPNEPSTTSGSGGSKVAGGSETAAPEDEVTSFDALFDEPTNSNITPNVITGLWAGTTYSADIRLKITTSKILIAAKCGDTPATGIEVGANVSFNSIKVLASKSAGSGYCSIKVVPVGIPNCSSGGTYECFSIDDTEMNIAGTLFTVSGASHSRDFTKLSD